MRKGVIEVRILEIGADFDGVVIYTNSLKAQFITGWYGVKVALSQCRRKILVANGILTNSQYDRVRDEVVVTDIGVFADSMPGALACITKLRQDGHRFDKIITLRREDGVKIARRWFEFRKFDINVLGVEFGSSDKKEAARGLDVFIDDDLENLKPLVGVVEHLYLFSHLHNKGENENGIAKRISSWEQFYGEIQILCQE